MNYEDLSPEIKAKLQECKSAEDLVALAKSEGYELSDEELSAISGGTWCGMRGTCFYDPQCKDRMPL